MDEGAMINKVDHFACADERMLGCRGLDYVR
jgi:hypothetical protein